MPEFSTETVAVWAALILPGFIGMRTYALLHPSPNRPLKDFWPEAVLFGLMNLVFVWWPLDYALGDSGSLVWRAIALIFCGMVSPIMLAWISHRVVRWLAREKHILNPLTSGWDHYFLRGNDCWVIVHMSENRRLGGYFGSRSFAGLGESSGHLYLEEVWELDDDGQFSKQVANSDGVILSPESYIFVEFLKP